jgi:hypothetical protein
MAVGANLCWSMDSVSDKLADGRSFPILTAVNLFYGENVYVWKPIHPCPNDGGVWAREETSTARQHADERP